MQQEYLCSSTLAKLYRPFGPKINFNILFVVFWCDVLRSISSSIDAAIDFIGLVLTPFQWVSFTDDFVFTFSLTIHRKNVRFKEIWLVQMLNLHRVLWSVYFPDGKLFCAIWRQGLSTDSWDSHGYKLCTAHCRFVLILLREGFHV